jgi:hypothetical protein
VPNKKQQKENKMDNKVTKMYKMRKDEFNAVFRLIVNMDFDELVHGNILEKGNKKFPFSEKDGETLYDMVTKDEVMVIDSDDVPTPTLRDIQYAIKRMEDAIEFAWLDCGLDNVGYRVLVNDWKEVKKILEQGE